MQFPVVDVIMLIFCVKIILNVPCLSTLIRRACITNVRKEITILLILLTCLVLACWEEEWLVKEDNLNIQEVRVCPHFN